MPEFQEHCRISELRTGKRFEDLHRWMDNFAGELGKNHREQRHGLNDIETVKKRWGDEGVIEFLVHIIVDFRDTKNKLEKLFHVIKREKQNILDKNKELANEFNELLDEAENLEFAAMSGVEASLTKNFDRK